uniref:Choline/carnitine acyltransferase domain-containing protein n=1 Tax=Setaria digitata TaxID=48799 RepID=A0A915PQF8_9BILA
MLRTVCLPARECLTGNKITQLFNRNLKVAVTSANDITYGTLPKYPVPTLHNTVTKFMAFARPLQNDVEYSETVAIANGFLHSEEANQLQTLLEDRAHKMDNWLTQWWIDDAYLCKRTPLPFYSSRALLFPKFNYSDLDGQLEIAAKIIQSSLKYYIKIITNELRQEKFGNSLLCMNQFRKIFGTTRIASSQKDDIFYGIDRKPQPKHIVILRNGHRYVIVHNIAIHYCKQSRYSSDLRDTQGNSSSTLGSNDKLIFRLSVFDANGKVLSIEQLINEMKMHVIPNSVQCNQNPIGIISTDERSVWADYIVGIDGYCGMTYEQTASEVLSAAALMDFVCDEIRNDNFDCDDATGSIEPTVPVHFSISDNDKEHIMQSKINIDKIIFDTDIKVFKFDHFGKDFIKKCGISPDSFIQIAMQVAYYRIYGKQACISETATLRKFKDGRTDVIRLPNFHSAMFTVDVTESEDSERIPTAMMASMLRVAAQQHKKYSLEVMNGKGMDGHLLGLKMIAEEYGKPIPIILETKAYQKMTNFALLTSPIATRHSIPVIFGPSATNCYSICYNPRSDQLHFTICTLHSCKETCSSRFAEELENVLIDMRTIIIKEEEKEKAKM